MKVLREMRSASRPTASAAANSWKLLVTVTALNPYIGYTEAAASPSWCWRPPSIRDVALAEGLMTEAQLAEAFAPDNLLGRRR
jgi:aspartate ammonia-lyase